MNPEDPRTETPAEDADAPLLLRLQGREAEARAARAEARRLARELALVRRLLKFSGGGRVSAPLPPRADAAVVPMKAALLTERIVYHLDACEDRGTHTAISGWAFRPDADWDARDTVVTLRFRHGDTVYQAVARPVPRPDVAAYYAAQPADLTGGATGLEGVGFVCEVLHDSLPAGVDFKVGLRLERGGQACEQPTGTLLRV